MSTICKALDIYHENTYETAGRRFPTQKREASQSGNFIECGIFEK